MDFQKHYRMPAVYLMDPSRSFERQYNRNGWPFLMLVDETGMVVYQCNNLVDRDKTLMKHLQTIGKTPRQVAIREASGVPYMESTLNHNGETEKPLLCDRFPSITCGQDGETYTAYTSIEDHNSNVYLKLQLPDGQTEVIGVAATDADEYDGTVITDSQGRVWICWTSNARGRTYNIYLSSLDDVRNNKAPILVSQSKEDAMHGRMATDETGTVWITYYKWQKIKNNSRDKEVYLRKYAKGVVSEEMHVSPNDVSAYEDHTDPAIAILESQPVVCWSWDFHKPKGYTQEAESPTIFVRSLSPTGTLAKMFHVSDRHIDMTPSIGACGDVLWCAWDALGHGQKSLAIRKLNATSPLGGKQIVSGNLVNVCSPCFAFYQDTKGTLIWSQTKDGKVWSLQRADYDAQQQTWSKPTAVVTDGNPRFGSCTYDAKGQLWIAYSKRTDKGQEIFIQQQN